MKIKTKRRIAETVAFGAAICALGCFGAAEWAPVLSGADWWRGVGFGVLSCCAGYKAGWFA